MKPSLVSVPFFGDILCPGIKDCLHKGVAIVEEVSASLYQFFNQVEMLNQRRVDKLCEALLVVGQHLSSLFKGEALRAVAAVVRHMVSWSDRRAARF